MSKYTGRVIGLDVDGVILNYVSAFMKFAAKNGVRIGCTIEEMDSWSMQCAFPDLSKDEIWEMITDFSCQPDFSQIEPIDGAIETIDSLHKQFPGISLVAVTSAGSTDLTRQLRLANLKDIPFDEVHVLPLGVSKYEHLSQLPPASPFVDDLKKNVLTAEEAKLTGVLFRQPYNVNDTHHRVADGWQEVERHVHEIITSQFNDLRVAS